VPEIVAASKDGSLKEVFGSGTVRLTPLLSPSFFPGSHQADRFSFSFQAAIVSCVEGIGYEDAVVPVPCGVDGRTWFPPSPGVLGR
jgi:hypothetical protein